MHFVLHLSLLGYVASFQASGEVLLRGLAFKRTSGGIMENT